MDAQQLFFETILPLISAALLGSALGWEREMSGKEAGLRTHILVALGSAAFVVTGSRLIEVSGGPAAGGDPTRAVAGVATGIGFLGAGVILRRVEHIRGLTTAANIWVVGAAGAACGIQAYDIAIVTTAAALVTLTFMERFERTRRAGNRPSDDQR